MKKKLFRERYVTIDDLTPFSIEVEEPNKAMEHNLFDELVKKHAKKAVELYEKHISSTLEDKPKRKKKVDE